jgi:hypothetical protein
LPYESAISSQDLLISESGIAAAALARACFA